jgi:hypothetical protein
MPPTPFKLADKYDEDLGNPRYRVASFEYNKVGYSYYKTYFYFEVMYQRRTDKIINSVRIGNVDGWIRKDLDKLFQNVDNGEKVTLYKNPAGYEIYMDSTGILYKGEDKKVLRIATDFDIKLLKRLISKRAKEIKNTKEKSC